MQKDKKQKRQKERMPRKMKKRYKSLMKFFDDRRMEYDILKNLAVVFSAFMKDSPDKKPADDFIKNLVMAKCSTYGIYPPDIAKIEYNDKLQTATVTLNQSMQTMEIAVQVDKPEEEK